MEIIYTTNTHSSSTSSSIPFHSDNHEENEHNSIQIYRSQSHSFEYPQDYNNLHEQTVQQMIPILNQSISLDTTSTYTVKSLMGKVIENIPNPQPQSQSQQELSHLSHLSHLSQPQSQSQLLQPHPQFISFLIVAPKLTYFNQTSSDLHNLFLRFSFNNWNYETDVTQHIHEFPICWNEAIPGTSIALNSNHNSGLVIELMTRNSIQSNEILGFTQYTFDLTFKTHNICLDLINASMLVGTLNFQLKFSFFQDKSPPTLTTNNNTTTNNNNQLQNHDKLKDYSHKYLPYVYDSHPLHLDQNHQLYHSNSASAAVAAATAVPFNNQLLQPIETQKLFTPFSSSNLHSKRHHIPFIQPQPQSQHQQNLTKKARPKSATVSTGIIRIDEDISFSETNKFEKQPLKIGTKPLRRNNEKKLIPIPIVSPTQSHPTIPRQNSNPICVEVRGNKVSQQQQQQLQGKLAIKSTQLDYNRTIMTDQTTKSSVLCSSEEEENNHSHIHSHKEDSEREQHFEEEMKLVIERESTINLDLQFNSPDNLPYVPPILSPFKNEQRKRLSPITMTKTAITQRKNDKHNLFIYFDINDINPSPDVYYRQVDRALELSIWEECYSISMTRQEFLDTISQNPQQDFTSTLLIQSLLESNLDMTTSIQLSLLEPTSFIITLLLFNEDEFYQHLNPNYHLLLEQATLIIKELIKYLYGPWTNIRQEIIKYATNTNKSPKYWSNKFMNELFQFLDLRLTQEIDVASYLLTSDHNPYLLSSTRSNNNNTPNNQTEIRWKLYRRVLTYLDLWWENECYPSDIILNRDQQQQQQQQQQGVQIESTDHEIKTRINSEYIPITLKEKDIVQISFVQKLFRFYSSSSRVYSWTASQESLLRLSDLISNQTGIVTKNIPVTLNKRRLNYQNMSWISLQSPSKYTETILSSLQEIEPVCGKFILVPSFCLKLLHQRTNTNSNSNTHNETSAATTTTRIEQSLKNLPLNQIVTGMIVTVVPLDQLSRVYERFPWWDKPNIITLQNIASKSGHIISTIHLQESNRVGVSIKNQQNIELTEIIPIEGLFAVVEKTHRFISSSPVMEVNPAVTSNHNQNDNNNDNDNDDGQKLFIIENNEVKERNHTVELFSEQMNGHGQFEDVDVDCDVDCVGDVEGRKIKMSMSDGNEFNEALDLASSIVLPLKVSAINSHHKLQVDSLSPTLPVVADLSPKNNKSIDSTSQPIPVIRPLYRATTTGELEEYYDTHKYSSISKYLSEGNRHNTTTSPITPSYQQFFETQLPNTTINNTANPAEINLLPNQDNQFLFTDEACFKAMNHSTTIISPILSSRVLPDDFGLGASTTIISTNHNKSVSFKENNSYCTNNTNNHNNHSSTNHQMKFKDKKISQMTVHINRLKAARFNDRHSSHTNLLENQSNQRNQPPSTSIFLQSSSFRQIEVNSNNNGCNNQSTSRKGRAWSRRKQNPSKICCQMNNNNQDKTTTTK